MRNTLESRKSKGKDMNENTQIHMSTVYTRQKPPNRTFSFVICRMLIGSMLLGSIALSGGNVASAATFNPTTQPGAAAQQVVNYQEDEQALIANLSLAVKVIKESGWTPTALTNILDSLEKIDTKANSPFGFLDVASLKPIIQETEKVAKLYGSDGLSTLRSGETLTETIARIKRSTGMETILNNATQSTVSKKNEVKIFSAIETTPSVVIDGVKQSYPQPPVIQNNSTLVPLRGIFESLGATVEWNAETETVTATKDRTEVSLRVGKEVAYVNGKQVKLAAPSVRINDSTMVPLRFVSEVFGGTVKWDNDTQTAYIETGKGSGVTTSQTGQMVGKIKVLYGKHTYGSVDQNEYTAVLKIVNQALKGYDDIVFGGDQYSPYYYQYLDGARWTGDTRDRSLQNRALKSAENTIGPLVEEGLNKDEIVKVYKVVNVALKLIQGKADPGDGSPSSAADNLLHNRSDCDAEAEVYSVVFDAMAYNTAIIGGANHAQVIIKLGGSWFTTAAGAFEKVDVQAALKNGSAIVSDPTFGRTTL
ncbi:copper amine oxidase N-terminal domain-containing protein [Paenibacillus sp. 32352]|uniref:stalk domain-containing protein n=1 Tax=Paenibacillus sp. 32352 TaxID=1969111 RepID=UPI0009ABFF9A|nr:copper amine oxidase N-terminal domain-containing protein [Paenibacillus sp. 32352]